MRLQIEECGKGYTASLNGKIIYNIERSKYKWIARDQYNKVIDKDQYRYDLFERLQLL